QSESHPPQREPAQEHDQRRWTRDDAARHSEREELPRCHVSVSMVMPMRVGMPVGLVMLVRGAVEVVRVRVLLVVVIIVVMRRRATIPPAKERETKTGDRQSRDDAEPGVDALRHEVTRGIEGHGTEQ